MADEKPAVDLTEDKLFFLGWNLLYCPVCAPASWTCEQVENAATRENPPGTSRNRWVMTEAKDDERLGPFSGNNPHPCPDAPGRMHWLLTC